MQQLYVQRDECGELGFTGFDCMVLQCFTKLLLPHLSVSLFLSLAFILLSLCNEVEECFPRFEHSAVFGMHISSQQEATLLESCALPLVLHVICIL